MPMNVVVIANKKALSVFDNNPFALNCYHSVGITVTDTDTYS